MINHYSIFKAFKIRNVLGIFTNKITHQTHPHFPTLFAGQLTTPANFGLMSLPSFCAWVNLSLILTKGSTWECWESSLMLLMRNVVHSISKFVFLLYKIYSQIVPNYTNILKINNKCAENKNNKIKGIAQWFSVFVFQEAQGG